MFGEAVGWKVKKHLGFMNFITLVHFINILQIKKIDKSITLAGCLAGLGWAGLAGRLSDSSLSVGLYRDCRTCRWDESY